MQQYGVDEDHQRHLPAAVVGEWAPSGGSRWRAAVIRRVSDLDSAPPDWQTRQSTGAGAGGSSPASGSAETTPTIG